MSDHNMREYYSARAPEYEQIYYRDVPARRREIDEEATRLEELAQGKRVIDLACGTGYWTEVLSRTAKSIVAVDTAEEMLKVARLKNYSCEVEFVQSDMFALSPDQQFDLVSVGFWFSHQTKQEYETFFGLIRSLIKPDAKVWLIDNNPPAESSVNKSIGSDEHGNNFKLRKLDNGGEFVILKNYFEADQLRDIFTPHFEIEKLTFGEYYWSLLLK